MLVLKVSLVFWQLFLLILSRSRMAGCTAESVTAAAATTTTSTTPNSSTEPPTQASISAAPHQEKPIALVASPCRRGDVTTWCGRNKAYLTGRIFVVSADMAELLLSNPETQHLHLKQIDSSTAFDILLAGQIIQGEISKVIYFGDNSGSGGETAAKSCSQHHHDGKVGPDVDLLVRACRQANIPVALNEATADILIRNFVDLTNSDDGAGGSGSDNEKRQSAAAIRMAYLIFNPVAGQGNNSDEELALIYKTLEPQIPLTVIQTKPDVSPAQQSRQVIEMIRNRPKSSTGVAPIILASGGDGTVSAVASALIGTGIPFGVIPRGTANAFSVALGIPTVIEQACENILRGSVRMVDAAMYNDNQPMILLAGIGFEAGMVGNASREVKNVLGPIAYVLGGVHNFFTQETFKCRIQIDGQESKEIEAVAITVATVAPATSIFAQGFGQVVPDDGLLDVTINTASNMLEHLDALAHLFGASVVKQPTDTEAILRIQAKEVSIKSCSPKQKIVVDGELGSARDDFTFKVIPCALSVITPPPELTECETSK